MPVKMSFDLILKDIIFPQSELGSKAQGIRILICKEWELEMDGWILFVKRHQMHSSHMNTIF
jgi:hypothetical protein